MEFDVVPMLRAAAGLGLISPQAVFADQLDTGDTAWVITATALVLFMTIPGLAMFYAGYPRILSPPHNIPMTMAGTAMLWVGWFGFNGGSALAANGQAAMAVVVTQISPCLAALTWIAIEWIRSVSASPTTRRAPDSISAVTTNPGTPRRRRENRNPPGHSDQGDSKSAVVSAG